ncbi:hypothetical protein [Neisseria sp. Ec49-e6-T10]|uniref:hypothetical protein n=1 Tax=Neisseria sp. Ec49-e6-T10 TaxID=3140744 RepID=UPI003EBDB78F
MKKLILLPLLFLSFAQAENFDTISCKNIDVLNKVTLCRAEMSPITLDSVMKSDIYRIKVGSNANLEMNLIPFLVISYTKHVMQNAPMPVNITLLGLANEIL